MTGYDDTAGPAAVGRRLEQARLEAQVRQGRDIPWRELAAVAGIQPGQLPRMRRGDRQVTFPELLAFAALLGVRPAWLAWGEAPMWPSERAALLPEVETVVPPRTDRRHA